MTLTTDSQQSTAVADASDGPLYPDIADVSQATAEAVEFFRSFFTAKTGKNIEATHAHFHPDKTVYFDATLGWGWPTNADLRQVWEQYMPGWTAEAKSYPTRILGDTNGAVVFMTDTPELFGGEIRAIAVIDLEDGKIVRWVDYWDGRGFGNIDLVRSMRVPDDSYPHELGASTVTDGRGKIAAAAHELNAALGAGDAARAGELFAYDVQFEDMALRIQIRGRAAVTRYLERAMSDLPYARASIRHTVGTDRAGGYEWQAEGRTVPRGAAALELDDEGKIAGFTVVWDGSLLDDLSITAAAAQAIDRETAPAPSGLGEKKSTMQIEGITWHGVTLDPDQFSAMNTLCREVFGLTPMIEQDGWTLFPMENGTILDLFEPDSDLIPAYGLNDGIVFGFRVGDIDAAAAELQTAGYELLCDVQRIPEMNYAYCHFRGPDGRVYGLNEQK